MLRSSLYDYSDACILLSGTTTITWAGAVDAAKRLDKKNKRVIFKNCQTLSDCISELRYTQRDNARYIDVAVPMYNLIEYYNNYSKTSESLKQYYRDDSNDSIKQSESCKLQSKVTGKTLAADNTKDVEIELPLKYLSNFGELLKCL